jgi:hypothetical protein
MQLNTTSKEEKFMYTFQTNLFYDLQFFIQNSSFYRKYFLLFSALDISGLKDGNSGIGCTGYSRHAFLKALLIKHGEHIKSIPKLIRFLEAHPVLTEMCGFSIGVLPHESQWYRFLNCTNNSVFEKIHHALNKKLIDQEVISLSHFIMDSKPVMAATKENNAKNPKRNTRNKHKQPKRNPAATLGYYSYQEVNGKKDNYMFFWGYRTHVIVSREGIPLVELTLPTSYTDATVAYRLINKLKRVYGLKQGRSFIADAAYDERELYTLIVDTLTCKAYIPLNPRNTQQEKNFSTHGLPLCDANLEMSSAGIWKENNRTRAKFRCPLKTSKKRAAQLNNKCPGNHPLFAEGAAYGCTKYLDITNDARARVMRDSTDYKITFALRTEVERYFARLGDREVEQTTHYKMKAIKNQMTIAHLFMSLVAYAAACIMKQHDNIRSYETFADDHLPAALAG